MASITWYLPLLVLLVNTSNAASTGPVLVKSEGIKTVTHSTDGVVKGVKGIAINSITTNGLLKPTAPPSPKNLPEDIDPFAISPGPPSSVNNNVPFVSPGSEGEGPSFQGGEGGTVNTVQNGAGSVTKTTVTKSITSVTHPGGSNAQPTGGIIHTLQPLGPGTTAPGAPGGPSILTSTGVNRNPFVGSTITSGRQGPTVPLPSTTHGTLVGLNNVPAPSVINSRTSNIHSVINTGVNNLPPGAIPPVHAVPSVGVTGSGVEVEVPGFTTGLDRRWKWVLGRRTGMFPPYIQALDPEVLYYKLGYQAPSLPVLPEPVQRLLNNIPVQPAGSGIYGRRGSTTLIDIIRKIARITALKNLLSSSKLAHKTNQTKLLTSLIASETSSSLGASPIERLLLQSDSQSSPVQPGIWSNLVSFFGSDPYGFSFRSPYAARFGSPYSSFYGSTYGSNYGSPWSTFPGAPFPGNTWPYYGSSPLTPYTPYGPGAGPYSSFSTYGIPSGSSYPGFPGYGGSSLTKSILSTISGINSGSTGMRYGTVPDGTLSPLIDPFSTVTKRGYYDLSVPGSSKSVTERLMDVLAHPRQYTMSPNGELSYNNDATPYGTGPVSSLLGGTSNPLYNLFRNTAASKTSLDRLTRSGATYPYILLNLLRRNPQSPVVNAIVKQMILQQRPGSIFSTLLNSVDPNDSETDGASKIISLLRTAISNPNDIAGQHLARLAGISPETLGLSSNSKTSLDPATLLRGLRQPTEGTPYDSLNKLLLGAGEPFSRTSSRRNVVTADYISSPETYNTYTNGQPELADSFLTADGPRETTVGTKEIITKTVAPSNVYTSAFMRQPISKTQVVSRTYSSRVQPTLTPSLTPTTSGLHVTEHTVQPSSPLTLLGLRNVPGLSSGTLPLYGTSSLHPQFTTGTQVTTSPGVFVNGQFVSSTNGILGSTLGQTGLPITTAAYTAGIPLTTGYVSGTTTSHPYILGGSQIGVHPHYIVEGHEAPGTRWQLKVWRNHPGVSTIIPGVSGYTSYVSGTPTMGLVGSPSLSGIPVVGGTGSHYIVHGPAGSAGVNRIISSVGTNQATGAFVPGTQSVSGTISGGSISSGDSFTTSPGSSSSTTRYYYSSSSGGNGYSGVASGTNGGITSGLQGSSGNSLSSFDSNSGSSDFTQDHLSQTKLK
uniref:Basic tail secreted protein n=1 Tax=Rhipicephalus zambeziensis TaxID=60191 RepID=A0A224Y1R0_9ACAR